METSRWVATDSQKERDWESAKEVIRQRKKYRQKKFTNRYKNTPYTSTYSKYSLHINFLAENKNICFQIRLETYITWWSSFTSSEIYLTEHFKKFKIL